MIFLNDKTNLKYNRNLLFIEIKSIHLSLLGGIHQSIFIDEFYLI